MEGMKKGRKTRKEDRERKQGRKTWTEGRGCVRMCRGRKKTGDTIYNKRTVNERKEERKEGKGRKAGRQERRKDKRIEGKKEKAGRQTGRQEG